MAPDVWPTVELVPHSAQTLVTWGAVGMTYRKGGVETGRFSTSVPLSSSKSSSNANSTPSTSSASPACRHIHAAAAE